MTAALPGDLVGGRERDQVGEAFERHGVAVVHMGRDRFAEWNWTWHALLRYDFAERKNLLSTKRLADGR
ncbi:hypothetical protein GCM10009743_09310 [Kribbella swartbergensis]